MAANALSLYLGYDVRVHPGALISAPAPMARPSRLHRKRVGGFDPPQRTPQKIKSKFYLTDFL